MSRNSKAKRDAHKKQRPRAVPAQREPMGFAALSDQEELRVLGVPDSEPETVKRWILGRGEPEEYLRWAIGYLAAWDGDENDDGLGDTAATMLKEYVTDGSDGQPLSPEEIDELQYWTARQCMEFARQVAAAAG